MPPHPWMGFTHGSRASASLTALIGCSLEGLWHLFQKDESIPGAPPDDTDMNWNAPGNAPVPEQSPLEIYITAPPTGCDAHQASGSQALPRGTGSSICEAATGRLVRPRDCKDKGENARIQEIQRKMDPKTLTSTDPLCQLKDGVKFWIKKVTEQIVEPLR